MLIIIGSRHIKGGNGYIPIGIVSPMIEITDVQAQILEVFINHQNSFDRSSNNVGPKKRGLSSVGISKKGINKRTFLNNCAFLVNHYLIKIIHEEEHP